MLHPSRTVIASLFALTLVACGGSDPASTIVRVPVSELPALGPITLPGGPPFAVVTTIDGSKHTVIRPIEHIEFDLKKQAVPITVPFKARIQGEELEVLTDVVRTYRVPDISYAAVRYSGLPPGTVSPGRRAAGVGMMIGSIVPLALGTYILVEYSGHSGGGGYIDLSGLIPFFGGAVLVLGAGLFIAGVSVATYARPPKSATPPTKTPPANTTFVRPQLRVSPTGASFSTEF